MGIGKGGTTLWAHLNGAERIMKLKEISYVISLNAGDRTRIALDTAYIKEACFSVIWSNVVGTNGEKKKQGDISNLNKEYLIRETRKLLIAKHKIFIENRMIPIWCMDGDKDKDKLATNKRMEKCETPLISVISSYMKAKKISKDGSESRKRIEKFKYIEEAYYTVSDKFTEDTIKIGERDTFENCYNEICNFLPMVKIKCKGFDNIIYEVFNDEIFRNSVIRIPSISEGEKLASILTQIGFCEAVHANDSDCVIFGAKNVFFKKRTNKNSNPMYDNDLPENKNDPWYSFYNYQDILKIMGLNPNEMIYLAIRMGTDFNDKVLYDSFYDIVKEIKEKTNPDIFDFNKAKCGRLNPDICIKVFSITSEIKQMVKDEVKKQLMIN